jgi:hypothetical protein
MVAAEKMKNLPGNLMVEAEHSMMAVYRLMAAA